jgi:hypothetical protein
VHAPPVSWLGVTDLPRLACTPTCPHPSFSSASFQDETPSAMPVAEVTYTDRRKTRYRVESRDDVAKTQQGYKIEAASGEVVHISADEVETISVVDE